MTSYEQDQRLSEQLDYKFVIGLSIVAITLLLSVVFGHAPSSFINHNANSVNSVGVIAIRG